MAEQNRNNTNVPILAKVIMEEYESFNDIISTSTLKSDTLEKKISGFFGSVFADFEGCKIVPSGVQGQFESLKCKLYFKPCMSKSDESLYAVKVRGEAINRNNKRTLGPVDLINTVNMLSNSKQFDLEPDAKDILSEYIIIREATFVDRFDEDLGKVIKIRHPRKWNQYMEEVTDVVNGTRFQNPYLVVTLDLIPIVAKLYGKKDQEEVNASSRTPKDRYQYSVNIARVINPTIYSYILEIRRMDIREMDQLAHSIGYGMVSGNILMTRK